MIDPLTPKSDQHLVSPHNNTPESNIKVMRIKDMITHQRIILIVKHILPTGTIRKVSRTVWRIY